jgi:putative FmdB family regulatory protein
VPVYEYRCDKKGHEFEVVQRMSDDPITECPTCGSSVARVLFAPAIHFKGSGFHNTDYGTRKRSRDGDASGGDGAKTDGAKADGGTSDGAKSDGGGASSGDSGGAKTKQATPKDRAARGVGP